MGVVTSVKKSGSMAEPCKTPYLVRKVSEQDLFAHYLNYSNSHSGPSATQSQYNAWVLK